MELQILQRCHLVLPHIAGNFAQRFARCSRRSFGLCLMYIFATKLDSNVDFAAHEFQSCFEMSDPFSKKSHLKQLTLIEMFETYNIVSHFIVSAFSVQNRNRWSTWLRHFSPLFWKWSLSRSHSRSLQSIHTGRNKDLEYIMHTHTWLQHSV